MKTTLFVKALRDMRRHIGAYLACALVMAIGVVFYSSMTQVITHLPDAQQEFYTDYRFADAFAKVSRMPSERIKRLASIPGVTAVSGRLTAKVRLSDEGSNTDILLISYDPQETNRLNDILITEGDAPQTRSFSVALSEGFYRANGLTQGDTLQLAVRGNRVDFTVAGSFLSPEYVYIVPEGSIFPDDQHFGIAYAPLETLSTLLDMNGVFNDVSFLLDDGVTFTDVKPSLQDALSSSGLIQLVERKDQMSHNMLETEISQMRNMVGVIPFLFLAVGAMIMSVVIKRIVEQQHTEIGIMKAFGYTTLEVLAHFALYGVAIGLAASLIGGVLGALVASYIADLYQTYFAMPGISGAFSLSNALLLTMPSLIFGIGASLYGARNVLRLKAAEAMRPPSPPSGKPILLERMTRLWRRMRSTSQMALRNLFRSRSRSLMTLLGLVICYALIASVFAFEPIITYMMTDNYYAVQKFDLKITLNEFTDARALEKTLRGMQAVRSAEAVAEIPVTLRAKDRSKDVTLMLLSPGASLYRLYDKDDRPLPVPAQGVALTYRMAEAMGVAAGDEIMLDIPMPERKVPVKVAMLCEQYISNTVIADSAYLSGLLHMKPFANGAMLSVNQQGSARLKEQLDDARSVNSVMDVAQLQKKMAELIETSMSTMNVMAVMAIFAGFAIVYNAGVVILSERTRELASMRILGFSLWETIRVVSLEQWLLCAAGVLFGIPLSGMTMQALVQSVSADAFTMPSWISFSSHVAAVCCIMGAWLAAMAITARKLRRLPLVDVLKERE